MNGSLFIHAIILLSHDTHYFESIDIFEYFFITWFQTVTKQYFLSIFFFEWQHRVFCFIQK